MTRKDPRGLVEARIQADRLIKALKSDDSVASLQAAQRFLVLDYFKDLSADEILERKDEIKHRQAQAVIAIEHDFKDWNALRAGMERAERAGRYYIDEGWGHIFSDGFEHTARFAWDRQEQRVVAVQVQRSAGWARVRHEVYADLTDSLSDNHMPEDIERAARGQVTTFTSHDGFTDELPEWAYYSANEAVDEEVTRERAAGRVAKLEMNSYDMEAALTRARAQIRNDALGALYAIAGSEKIVLPEDEPLVLTFPDYEHVFGIGTVTHEIAVRVESFHFEEDIGLVIEGHRLSDPDDPDSVEEAVEQSEASLSTDDALRLLRATEEAFAN